MTADAGCECDAFHSIGGGGFGIGQVEFRSPSWAVRVTLAGGQRLDLERGGLGEHRKSG